MEDNNKEILIAPIDSKFIMYKLAESCQVAGCNSYAPFLRALNHLRSIVGDGCLKTKFSDDYKKKIMKLNQATVYANIVETYLIGLKNKTVIREDISSKRFIQFKKAVAYLSLLDYDIFDIFNVLLDNSSLRRLTIPSKIFSDVRVEKRRFDREIEEKPKEHREELPDDEEGD